MTRSAVLALAIYALVIGGLALLEAGLLVLALPLLLYFAVSLLQRPLESELTLERSLDEQRLIAGEATVVTLHVRNGPHSVDEVTIREQHPPGMALVAAARTVLTTTLQPHEEVELSYTLTGRRGIHSFGPVEVTLSDHSALFPQRRRIDIPNTVIVLPAADNLQTPPLRPRRTRVYAGSTPARKGGPGVEFFGVRSYQPGDSRRWINQRVTARSVDEVFVNEFEQMRSVDIGLILDVRAALNLFEDGRSLLEYSVSAAATLADTFLKQGNRVGLFQYGGAIDWTYPGYGKVQRERIMQALARARPETHQIFRELKHIPTRLFPARSQLVLVSPLTGDDVEHVSELRARGYHVLVISPDPIGFELRTLPDEPHTHQAARIVALERRLLLQRLRAAGVHVHEWDVDRSFVDAVGGMIGRLPS